MSATLHVLPSADLPNVPAMLRKLADAIERGEYPGCDAAVVVLPGPEVFGMGAADAMFAHYLLAQAQRKIERVELL